MKKTVIAKLRKSYSIAPLQYHGELCILAAAERDRCILFDAQGREKATVWKEPGGTMAMAQVPGVDGQFLAIQRFYSPDDSEKAEVILATPLKEGKWKIQTLIKLPFVHRIDVLQSGGEKYLIACTLKSGHKYEGDWTEPGKVYAARLPEDLTIFDEEYPLELEEICSGLMKNHGYCKLSDGFGESAIVCGENGIFRFYPPKRPGDIWSIEQLLNEPASDAVLVDLDSDGESELVVLTPFHGSELRIYKKENGSYQPVYGYPEKAQLLHAIWGGMLGGRPTAVIGHREGAGRLLTITWNAEKKEYESTILDEGCGPANVYVYSLAEKDILIAANREMNEIAMYVF